jgi:hypothetical protein
MWKEAVVAYFKVLTQNLPQGSMENHKIIIKGCCRDANPGPSEHEVKVVSTQSRRVVLIVLQLVKEYTDFTEPES